MGNWIPKAKPPWWDTIKKFAKHPVGTILGIALTMVLSIVLSIFEKISWAIQVVFIGDPASGAVGLLDAFVLIINPIVGAGQQIGLVLLSIIATINRTIVFTVASSGPFAPIVAAVLWTGWLLAAAKGLEVLLGVISPRILAVVPGLGK